MREASLPLTALSGAQGAQALERFTIIRPTLEKEITQARVDVWLLDEAGKPARPWLTVIEDDYSRAIASDRLSFQESTALTTALTLRTAIWRKEDPHWHVCGIPSVFYNDPGSDFTSRHIFNRNLYLVGETSTGCNRGI